MHSRFSGWLVALGATTLLLAGCGQSPDGPAFAPAAGVRGITLVDWTRDGYADAEAARQLDRLAATGANTLVVVVTAYQASAATTVVRADPERTPSEAAVSEVVLQAKSRVEPLAVCLKLHVDLEDGAWRGTIAPVDAKAWFASYEQYVMPWARLSEQVGVDQLIVGTELAGTRQHDRAWRDLIDRVRGVYGGELAYAASWDEAGLISFWDAVDVVGVNFYAPVSTRRQTNRFDILREWQPWIDRMRLLHKQTGHDVLVTEIGYRSVDGAGLRPYEFRDGNDVDLEEQAHLYWAALQAVGEQPWIRGLYWWNWPARRTGVSEWTDYTPQDKPAEGELRDAWLR